MTLPVEPRSDPRMQWFEGCAGQQMCYAVQGHVSVHTSVVCAAQPPCCTRFWVRWLTCLGLCAWVRISLPQGLQLCRLWEVLLGTTSGMHGCLYPLWLTIYGIPHQVISRALPCCPGFAPETKGPGPDRQRVLLMSKLSTGDFVSGEFYLALGDAVWLVVCWLQSIECVPVSLCYLLCPDPVVHGLMGLLSAWVWCDCVRGRRCVCVLT